MALVQTDFEHECIYCRRWAPVVLLVVATYCGACGNEVMFTAPLRQKSDSEHAALSG
jgi:hypothetical protein